MYISSLLSKSRCSDQSKLTAQYHVIQNIFQPYKILNFKASTGSGKSNVLFCHCAFTFVATYVHRSEKYYTKYSLLREKFCLIKKIYFSALYHRTIVPYQAYNEMEVRWRNMIENVLIQEGVYRQQPNAVFPHRTYFHLEDTSPL
jgi:hypothetical protein